MEVEVWLVVEAAWCLWLLLGFSSPQPKNKLEVMVVPLDLDLEVTTNSFCTSAAAAQDQGALLATRHGGETKKVLLVFCFRRSHLQQGSIEAAPGSLFTAVLRRLPCFGVERRPLPTSSSASVLVGQRLQVINNLQAKMPNRWPSYSSSEGPRCLIPSSYVPGGEVLVCAARSRCGVIGAGLDCVFVFPSSVLCGKSVDLFVISYFLVVLHVIVPPPVNECF